MERSWTDCSFHRQARFYLLRTTSSSFRNQGESVFEIHRATDTYWSSTASAIASVSIPASHSQYRSPSRRHLRVCSCREISRSLGARFSRNSTGTSSATSIGSASATQIALLLSLLLSPCRRLDASSCFSCLLLEEHPYPELLSLHHKTQK